MPFDEPSGKRQEKLDLARKKLKRYRERKSSSSSRRSLSRGDKENDRGLVRGDSVDSLADSTASDFPFSTSKSQPGEPPSFQQFSRPSSSASSPPSGPTAFQHDDLRSPFQRVRKTSHCSNSGGGGEEQHDSHLMASTPLSQGQSSPFSNPQRSPVVLGTIQNPPTQNLTNQSGGHEHMTNQTAGNNGVPSLASYFGTGSSSVDPNNTFGAFAISPSVPSGFNSDIHNSHPPLSHMNVNTAYGSYGDQAHAISPPQISDSFNTSLQHNPVPYYMGSNHPEPSTEFVQQQQALASSLDKDNSFHVTQTNQHQRVSELEDETQSPLNHFQVQTSAAEPENLLVPLAGEKTLTVTLNKGGSIEEDDDSGEATPVVSTADDFSAATATPASQSSSGYPSLQPPPLQRDSTKIDELQTENEVLKKTCIEQQHNYQQTVAQLQQLHSHYTQLHAAYSSLAEQQQRSDSHQLSQNENKDQELQHQIQQHLQTMSVLVEEKTELQSQLRQAMEIANEKHMENEELQGRLKANREKIQCIETSVDTLSSSRGDLEKTLQKQKAELSKCRQESAQWEAKVVGMQQDRSETLARLKVKAREVDRLQAELGDLRKELHMKEIYVRQLTAAGAQPHVYEEMERTIGELKDANGRLRKENEETKAMVEHWKWEAAQHKEQYETYGRQLNQKIMDLSAEVEKLSEEKLELQSKVSNMEENMKLTLEKQGNIAGSSTDDNDMQVATAHVESAELQQLLTEALHRCAALDSQVQALLQAVIQRDEEIGRIRAAVVERDSKLGRMEEEVQEKSQCADDTKDLLNQLQSQKVTVSRAVAQNVQLKEQLVELQDKFVAMTEENATLTDKLQSSTHSLQQLNTELETKTGEFSEVSRNASNLQERLNLVMGESLAKANIETQLRVQQDSEITLRQQLQTAQAEIERIRDEKEKLKEQCAFLQAESHDTVADVVAEAQKVRMGELEKRVEELEREVSETDALRSELTDLQRTLTETRANSQRFANENAELHHIMAQNAADENQNTIHVELQQAFNRITALSNENDRLREVAEALGRRLAESAQQLQQQQNVTGGTESPASSTSSPHQPHNPSSPASEDNNNGTNISIDDHSSLCSEHNDRKRDAVSSVGVEKMREAMEALQTRFTRAMKENADLSDQNQHMEHLVTQLQFETETIGEYITIYQHQRKNMRERLKEKEQFVAKLSIEKDDMQRKLSELQSLMVDLLDEKGSLHVYTQLPPTHQKPHPSPPSQLNLKPRPKSLSQSEMDEVTGTEHVVPMVETPVTVNGSINGDMIPSDAATMAEIDSRSECPSQTSERSSLRHHHSHHLKGGAAEKILRILTELQNPQLSETLTPSDYRNLHCKYCTGKLITI